MFTELKLLLQQVMKSAHRVLGCLHGVTNNYLTCGLFTSVDLEALHGKSNGFIQTHFWKTSQAWIDF